MAQTFYQAHWDTLTANEKAIVWRVLTHEEKIGGVAKDLGLPTWEAFRMLSRLQARAAQWEEVREEAEG